MTFNNVFALLIIVQLLLNTALSRIEKGVFCEECDLLRKRYCFERRCDRSHFCYRTLSASGCGNPYMYTIAECRSMHGGDCCYARMDLHGKRFNATNCVHLIPKVMCHSCTRMGGCTPISCQEGKLCYANRFDSGCANISDYQQCTRKYEKCCVGDTTLVSWNATQCHAEAAPKCELCAPQKKQKPLENCTTAKCPGLCYKEEYNKTIIERDNTTVKIEMVETGCSHHTSISTCQKSYKQCCISKNETKCIYNYSENGFSIHLKIMLTFFLLFCLILLILSLCFNRT